jgi:hypothetical protein
MASSSAPPSYSAGDCPICIDAGALIFVFALDSNTLFVACPACGCAWASPPDPHVANRTDPPSMLAPVGFRLATRDEISLAGLLGRVVDVHPIGHPATFDELNPLFERLALERGAHELLQEHFKALNNDDLATFRRTAYLLEANDGLPFERWWAGMRSLCPLHVTFATERVDVKPRQRRTGEGAFVGDLHNTIWVRVNADSLSKARTFSDSFCVWFIVALREWKVASRTHWWLDEPGEHCR